MPDAQDRGRFRRGLVGHRASVIRHRASSFGNPYEREAGRPLPPRPRRAMMNGILLLLLTLGATERGQASFRPTEAEARVPERFRLAAADFPYEREVLR